MTHRASSRRAAIIPELDAKATHCTHGTPYADTIILSPHRAAHGRHRPRDASGRLTGISDKHVVDHRQCVDKALLVQVAREGGHDATIYRIKSIGQRIASE